MTRKLASIQRIVSIEPIPEADKIEKATVLGWEVVVAKSDNLKPGDLVCYIEVDSILPEKPEFEFLRDKKFRVRTIRLRKQISQGLVLPLSILPSGKYNEGDDVTEILGIRKYDPQGDLEAKLMQEKLNHSKNRMDKFFSKYTWYRKLYFFFNPKADRGFPKFIKKTDEDRIQLFPDICEKEKDTIFSFTEKLDGQSGTYFLIKNPNKFLRFGKNKYIFGVCSRKLLLRKSDNSSYWIIAKQYNIRNVLEHIIGNEEFVVLQGEIIGEDIQKNKYNIKGYDFYAFNLIYPDKIIDNKWANIFLSENNIKFVPMVAFSTTLSSTIPEMVERSKGQSVLCNDGTLREGIVCRSYEKNISFKVVNPEFLLKYGE